MKLVLQGNLPLDQLEKYAEDYFLQIPTRDQTEQMFLNKRLNKIKQKNIFDFFYFFCETHQPESMQCHQEKFGDAPLKSAFEGVDLNKIAKVWAKIYHHF